MASSPLLIPDVLVLAGGGIVGEAWMHGLLAGIEDAAGADFRRTEAFVGTSAGSMVAAELAAGRRPRRPSGAHAVTSRPGTRAETSHRSPLRRVAGAAARAGAAVTAPGVPLALAAGAPGGALARAALLSRVPSHGRSLADLRARIAGIGPRFDGRLRVCAVDKRTGRRVVFGAPGAPRAAVADAVCASCAIPWVFAPVVIGGREYVDGGAWSVTNLDVAPAGKESRVLCLDPVASIGLARSGMGALRQAFRVAASVEITALRRRGAQVSHIGPDHDAAEAMSSNFMDPRRIRGAHAAGYRQGHRLATG